MKGVRNFLLLVGAMVALVLVVQMFKPRQFDWEPTFSHTDSNPFGCQLFDSIVRASTGNYEVTGLSLGELSEERRKPCAVLVVGDELDFGPTATNHLRRLLDRGHTVILAAHDFGPLIDRTYGFVFRGYLNVADAMTRGDLSEEKVCWADSAGAYPQRCYEVVSPMCAARLSVADTVKNYTVLARNRSGIHEALVAVRLRRGRGRLVLASVPMLFTNYAMLSSEESRLLAFRLLSESGGLPIVRTEYYNQDRSGLAEKSVSVFDYVLSQPSLRWAFWLSALAVVLLMLTNARRRQRAIPVVRPPRNRQLEFVKLIGTLYSQQHDNADLVRKKFQYTAEQLRRVAHVDLTEESEDWQTFRLLARQTGLDEHMLAKELSRIRREVAQMARQSDEEMKRNIDLLNEITKKAITT